MTEPLLDQTLPRGFANPISANPISANLSSANPSSDVLHGTLIGSRQRWRHLVSLAVDMAFETDADGRFVFISPDQVLGWCAAELIGQPSNLLLVDGDADGTFNPFRPITDQRGRLLWIRRRDASVVCMAFAVAPLYDPQGSVIGARGTATDITALNAQAFAIAGSLRRGEMLDYILWCVAQEVLAPRMMEAALSALVNALAAEGASVIAKLDGDRIELLHEAGPGSASVQETAARLAAEHDGKTAQATTVDGRLVLAVGCRTRFDANAVLAVWRNPDARPWDRDDTLLTSSAASIIRMVLEHEAIQHEMTRQASTDPLTGLLNRRAFMEQMQRQAGRLEQEPAPGTLMFVDMDAFKTVNDRFGHAMGDQTLVQVAAMLRELVRPFDLVARLGGDEFAIWMSGVDHRVAAERAEQLRQTVPVQLATLLGQSVPGQFVPSQSVPALAVPGLGVSIGIASRSAGSKEPIDSLIRRADLAMYEVKRNGRGHWRVCLLEDN